MDLAEFACFLCDPARVRCPYFRQPIVVFVRRVSKALKENSIILLECIRFVASLEQETSPLGRRQSTKRPATAQRWVLVSFNKLRDKKRSAMSFLRHCGSGIRFLKLNSNDEILDVPKALVAVVCRRCFGCCWRCNVMAQLFVASFQVPRFHPSPESFG